MKIYNDIFMKIVSLENLFLAWDNFKKDKKSKKDVMRFEWKLEDNIFQLHRDLKHKSYKHAPYSSFYINDPKQRHIHKASVRDRVLHHAMFSILNPVFEPTFIAHSFSCRIGKGTHKGINSLASMLLSNNHNNSINCFVLKCDIKKFFDAIDHNVLLNILQKRIKGKDAYWLLEEVIESFESSQSNILQRKGVPIGNLTSQLFANIYLNKFDQFIKHDLKIKHYCRYTDDFVIVSDNQSYLNDLIPKIKTFLRSHLQLELHPSKMSIRKFQQGIDFLGYVSLPYHRVIRSKTRQRMYRKLEARINEYRSGTISRHTLEQCLQSYLGVLTHADTHQLTQKLKNQFWFWINQ